ncbi:MAG: hypothetical protein LBE49_07990 [Deltaproteobacteria bacterium]|jgi:hypothetical protein|nr:hypothetical protein [Deltaproteobacteria bacterium]
MRKQLVAVVALFAALALSGCVVGGGKRLNLSFRPQGGQMLQSGIVQLLVFDQRNNKNLVGQAATDKDLLKQSQQGLVDLVTTFPTGNTVSLSHLPVQALVYETIKSKLQTLGITGGPETTGAKARVTVYVSDFSIDVEGSDYVGRVALQVVIDRPGLTTVYRSNAIGQGAKFKLVGDMGANDAMSEALTICVNNLDFSGLNSF